MIGDRLHEQDDAPDVVHRETVAEVLHRGARPAAQDAVVKVTWAGVASAARVIRACEVRRRRRHERGAGPLAVSIDAVATDAALEEHLLAPEQVFLGHRQGVAGEPVAPVDLREVGRLLELVLRRVKNLVIALEGRPVGALEAGVRLRKALVRRHNVLRVELARVAEQAGLPAAGLDEGDQLVDLPVREERLHRRHQ